MLASYRPTPMQAIGRGLYYGAQVTALATALTASIVLSGAEVLDRDRLSVAVGGLLLAPTFVGGVIGLLVGRRRGIDVNALGMRSVPESPTGAQPWPRVVDLRTERRGGRTEVAAYLDTGAAVRLNAPYNGRLLARDPSFEQKYFTLRQLWETHRSWKLPA